MCKFPRDDGKKQLVTSTRVHDNQLIFHARKNQKPVFKLAVGHKSFYCLINIGSDRTYETYAVVGEMDLVYKHLKILKFWALF